MNASISSSTNPSLSDSIHAQEPTKNDLLAEQVLYEVLEYHRTHRPKNTTKAYTPKQKEWQVCFFYFNISFYILLILCINI